MRKKIKKIAITTGDPAGIGPEITAKAIQFSCSNKNVIYIVIGKISARIPVDNIEKILSIKEAVSPKKLYWLEIDNQEILFGKPSGLSGSTAYMILEKTAELLNSKKIDAVVTCPISKEAIRLSHPGFIGHTEFFAEKSNTKNVIMSFWGAHFNLALLSTHIPITEVKNIISEELLISKLKLIHDETRKMIPSARFAILALNPHGGENGAFGKEDILIKKVLGKLERVKIFIEGPFPADSFFARDASNYNMIISVFHDQGLIPFKMTTSDAGVNVTLGLPFVRTSVDHGTAFDIAGREIASEKSLEQAIFFAEKMLKLDDFETNRNYSIFAKYYDSYMSHVNYRGWTNFVLNRYHKIHRTNPEKTLELACGTGNIACRLVKKGLDVEASDISAEMLKIASGKPFYPKLFKKDMLDPIQSERYNLILLLFDSMNYLLTKSKIRKLLDNVYFGLKEDGLFIFDCSTIKNCRENFDGFVDLDDQGNEYLIHQSELHKMIQTTTLTIFKRKGFLFERKDEIHKQKIYIAEDIVSIINASNLKLLGIYSIGTESNLLNRISDDLDHNYLRLFFVLQKNVI